MTLFTGSWRRFRKRISKEAMVELNNTMLGEFAKKGLSINEGDRRRRKLVKSASKSLSNNGIKKLKDKREPEKTKLSGGACDETRLKRKYRQPSF